MSKSNVMLRVCAAVALSVSVLSVKGDFPGGGGCQQGCHNDTCWKWSNSCYKFAAGNCCTHAWAVSTGGVATNLPGQWTSYKIYGPEECDALCPDKDDSVTVPFNTMNPPISTGSFPACYCAPEE